MNTHLNRLQQPRLARGDDLAVGDDGLGFVVVIVVVGVDCLETGGVNARFLLGIVGCNLVWVGSGDAWCLVLGGYDLGLRLRLRLKSRISAEGGRYLCI